MSFGGIENNGVGVVSRGNIRRASYVNMAQPAEPTGRWVGGDLSTERDNAWAAYRSVASKQVPGFLELPVVPGLGLGEVPGTVEYDVWYWYYILYIAYCEEVQCVLSTQDDDCFEQASEACVSGVGTVALDSSPSFADGYCYLSLAEASGAEDLATLGPDPTIADLLVSPREWFGSFKGAYVGPPSVSGVCHVSKQPEKGGCPILELFSCALGHTTFEWPVASLGRWLAAQAVRRLIEGGSYVFSTTLPSSFPDRQCHVLALRVGSVAEDSQVPVATVQHEDFSRFDNTGPSPLVVALERRVLDVMGVRSDTGQYGLPGVGLDRRDERDGMTNAFPAHYYGGDDVLPRRPEREVRRRPGHGTPVGGVVSADSIPAMVRGGMIHFGDDAILTRDGSMDCLRCYLAGIPPEYACGSEGDESDMTVPYGMTYVRMVHRPYRTLAVHRLGLGPTLSEVLRMSADWFERSLCLALMDDGRISVLPDIDCDISMVDLAIAALRGGPWPDESFGRFLQVSAASSGVVDAPTVVYGLGCRFT